MTIDDQFDSIVQDTLNRMASVRCSKADYRKGLQYLIEEVQTEIHANQATDDDDE